MADRLNVFIQINIMPPKNMIVGLYRKLSAPLPLIFALLLFLINTKNIYLNRPVKHWNFHCEKEHNRLAAHIMKWITELYWMLAAALGGNVFTTQPEELHTYFQACLCLLLSLSAVNMKRGQQSRDTNCVKIWFVTMGDIKDSNETRHDSGCCLPETIAHQKEQNPSNSLPRRFS